MNINILNKIKGFFNKYKNIINIILGVIIVGIFIYLVLHNFYFECYNKDEIHAWNIATDLSFFQIIKLMRAEGHTFIWYMMLKPFTYKPDIFFPWIIKYLNLFFVLLSVGLLWLYAPINKLFKILIIFSYPFLSCFAILGRCYGIGIFLLTLIAVFYKNRLKKPILFSSLLFLTANTSLMGAIAVFGICIVYVYELFKGKNIKNLAPILVMAAIPISLYIQWHNHISPTYSRDKELYKTFIFHVFEQYKLDSSFSIIPSIILYSGIIISLIYFRHNPKLLFGISISFITFLIFALKIYIMFDYHYLFMFIVFCVFYWIYTYSREKEESKIISSIFYIWFIALCILLSPQIRKNGYWFKNKYDLNDSLKCLYNNVPSNSVIYTTMFSLGHEIPYLRDKYILKTFNGDDLLTFDTYFNTYSIDPKYMLYDKKKLQSADVGNKKKYIVINRRFLTENFIKQKIRKTILTKEFVNKSIKCNYIYIYNLDN